MMSTPRRTFRNIVGHVEGVSDVTKLSSWVSSNLTQNLVGKMYLVLETGGVENL